MRNNILISPIRFKSNEMEANKEASKKQKHKAPAQMNNGRIYRNIAYNNGQSVS